MVGRKITHCYCHQLKKAMETAEGKEMEPQRRWLNGAIFAKQSRAHASMDTIWHGNKWNWWSTKHPTKKHEEKRLFFLMDKHVEHRSYFLAGYPGMYTRNPYFKRSVPACIGYCVDELCRQLKKKRKTPFSDEKEQRGQWPSNWQRGCQLALMWGRAQRFHSQFHLIYDSICVGNLPYKRVFPCMSTFPCAAKFQSNIFCELSVCVNKRYLVPSDAVQK